MKNKSFNVSILITAENKEQYISQTIESCLKQTYKKVEIIVAYTKLKNENFLKRKYKKHNIIFLKIKKKLRSKTQDQLYKIKKSLDCSRGKFIFLLDGDDLMKKNKIKSIVEKYSSSSLLIMDNYYDLKNSYLIKNRINSYRTSIIYRKVVNSWPKNVATSAISIDRKLLNNFFNKINFYKYEHLAIDILLVIYCYSENKFINLNKFLTIKKISKDSVDLKYQGFLNELFWIRRKEQHSYYKLLNKNNYLNIDYIITLFINKIINLF